VPSLMQIAETPEYWWDVDTYRWDPTHAIRLLVELRATAACRSLVDVFLRASDSDACNTWDTCVRHVPKLGAPMLDAAFDFLQEHPEHELSLAYLVSRFAEDDARVVALLARLVEIDPVNLACILESNRHRSWIPVMVRCLEKLAPEDVGAGLDAACHLVAVAGGEPARLVGKVTEWQAAWFRKEPFWYSRLHFGEQRPDGWVEAVPFNRHTLLCPCGRLATWSQCSCGLARRERSS